MRRIFYFIALFGSFCTVLAANIKKYNYHILEENIIRLENKPSDQLQWIEKMISKAKKEDNLLKLHRAYSLASTYTRGKSQEKYGDSLLMTAIRQKNPDIIGDCYLARGSIYMNAEKYPVALENYLKGYDYIKKNNNPYLIHNAEYFIAQTKIYLGQYQEANKILYKVVDFFRNNHKKINDTDYALYYIYSLISLIDTNSLLYKFKNNKELIKEGVNFIRKNNYNNYYSYFVSLEGTDAFYRKEYGLAIKKLKEALHLYDDQWKHLTEAYYLGLSYWHIGDREMSLPYLLQIDDEFHSTGKLDPRFRSAIELLVIYYKDKNNLEKQLYYAYQLIEIDKAYEKDYKSLHVVIGKKYDTAKLLEEIEGIEKSLIRERRFRLFSSIFLLVMLGIISWFAFIYYKRKKHYKILYHQIIENKIKTDIKPVREIEPFIDIKEDLAEINPRVLESILAYLENFEKEKKFLQNDISLHKIATDCGTNTNYLSKVINYYKKENFLSYINSLRLNYVVELWKKYPKYRYYSLQEISQLAGYNTKQSFSKNFRDKFEISATYFIKKLNKNNGLSDNTGVTSLLKEEA